jgi:hypothetical protein
MRRRVAISRGRLDGAFYRGIRIAAVDGFVLEG